MRILRIFGYDKTFTQPIVWVTTLVMVAFHIGALAALFVFSWKAFLLAMTLCWVAGGFGIGIGYHRLLTHRGYKTPKWMEYFLTVCGTLALEGGPIPPEIVSGWRCSHLVRVGTAIITPIRKRLVMA
jgi:fatty-acid desaturase